MTFPKTLATDPIVFHSLKERWDELVASKSYLCFDTPLIPILPKLNSLPGVCTVFSCSGHPPKNKDEPGDNRGYILFSYTVEGLAFLVELYTSLSLVFKHRVRLEFNNMVNIFDIDKKKKPHYMGVTLRLRVPVTSEGINEYWSAVELAVNTLIKSKEVTSDSCK